MYNKSLNWPVFKEINPLSFVFDDLLFPDRLESMGFEDMGEKYVLDIEMPGVKREDVKMEYIGNKIVIEGERKIGKRVNRFSKTIMAPQNAASDGLEVTLKDGILNLVLSKKESMKPRLIEIK